VNSFAAGRLRPVLLRRRPVPVVLVSRGPPERGGALHEPRRSTRFSSCSPTAVGTPIYELAETTRYPDHWIDELRRESVLGIDERDGQTLIRLRAGVAA
jgi:hypothetical protein